MCLGAWGYLFSILFWAFTPHSNDRENKLKVILFIVYSLTVLTKLLLFFNNERKYQTLFLIMYHADNKQM